jgi:hypothetical protein
MYTMHTLVARTANGNGSYLTGNQNQTGYQTLFRRLIVLLFSLFIIK